MKKLKRYPALLIAGAVLAGTIVAAQPAAAASTPDITYTKLPTNSAISAQKTASGKTIKDLYLKNGQLYMGYGDYTANTGPINVTSMNTATKAFTNALSSPTEEINVYREINGKLYAPQVDPRLAWNANVGYATNETGTWVTKNVTPFIQVYDVASTNNTDLWLSGSIADSTGKTSVGAAIKRSTDGGKTWVTEKSYKATGSISQAVDRYYWMSSAAGKLFAKPYIYGAPVNYVDVWDKGVWKKIADPNNLVPTITDAKNVVSANGKVYLANGNKIVTIDAATETISYVTLPANYINDLTVDGNTVYAVGYGVLGNNSIMRTVDGSTWNLVGNKFPAGVSGSAISSIAVDSTKNTLYLAGADASLYSAPLNQLTNIDVPKISGLDNVSFEAGTQNFDAMNGIVVTDKTDGDLTSKVQVGTSYHPYIVGVHTVNYYVTNSLGVTSFGSRTITVLPTKTPSVPAFINAAPVVRIFAGYGFDYNLGLQAVDTIDGDLTNKITTTGAVDMNKPGDYTITNKVTNSNGLTATVNRLIRVVSLEPTITGADSITLTYNSDFDPKAGVVVSDEFNGDMTDDVVVTGSVDTKTPGKYTLTYTATNMIEFTATVNRVVTVKANTAPVFTDSTVSVIPLNGAYDPQTAIEVTDAEDGVIPDFTFDTDVNPKVPGNYVTTYTATDSNGLKTVKVVNITVTN